MHRTSLLPWLALFAGAVTSALPEAREEVAVKDSAAEVRLSLLPNAPPVADTVRTEVLDWVRTFQNAVYRMRIREFVALTDAASLADHMTMPGGAEPQPKERVKFTQAVLVAFQRNFPMLREFFLFESCDIRRIDVKGTEAVVLARVWDEDQMELKVRWWLKQENGRWRMTDYEVITMNMRLSVILSLGSQMGQIEPPVAMAFQKMMAAQQEGRFQDLVEAADAAEKLTMPKLLREILLMGKIGALAQLGEADRLPKELDKLEAVAPDQPVLSYLRGAVAYDESDFPEVVKCLEKFGAASGHDSESWPMLTEALLVLDQPAKARAEAEKWMVDYPDSPDAVWTYWDSLEGNKDRARLLKPHLDRLAKVETGLEQLADSAELDEDAEALALAVDAMKTHEQDAQTIRDYEVILKELRGKDKNPAPDPHFKLPPPPP